MEFSTIATGSSGNCNVIRTENTTLIVDLGLTWVKMNKGLKHFDVDKIDGILITHEHLDHMQGLETVNRKLSPAIYATEGTKQGCDERKPIDWADYHKVDKPFQIGDFQITPISVYHDVYEPTGYVFEADGKRLTLITDTGKVDDEIVSAVSDSDAVLLESDYEKKMLEDCDYKWELKSRIMSEVGHLSNDDAASVLLDAVKGGRLKKAMLIHQSHNCNSPMTIYRKVRDKLQDNGYVLESDLMLSIADRETPSQVIRV